MDLGLTRPATAYLTQFLHGNGLRNVSIKAFSLQQKHKSHRFLLARTTEEYLFNDLTTTYNL